MNNKTKVWNTPEEYARLLLSDINNINKTKEELLNEILGHSISELTFLKRMIKYDFKRESSEDSLRGLLNEYLDDLIKEKRYVQDFLRKEYTNKEKQRTNKTNKILYQEDLGINFNGYPLEDLYLSANEGGLDEVGLCEKVKEALEEHKSLRFYKNLKYEIVVEVRAKEVV